MWFRTPVPTVNAPASRLGVEQRERRNHFLFYGLMFKPSYEKQPKTDGAPPCRSGADPGAQQRLPRNGGHPSRRKNYPQTTHPAAGTEPSGRVRPTRRPDAGYAVRHTTDDRMRDNAPAPKLRTR